MIDGRMHRGSRSWPLLAWALVSAAVACPCKAGSNAALDAAVRSWTRDRSLPSFRYALVDLNDDGISDAVILITDRRYCGSGGCSMIVLKGIVGGFEVISSNTLSREPVAVLLDKRLGWHTLAVLVSGGGEKTGSALMRFDGTRYPSNPSLLPRATDADLRESKTLAFVE